MYIYLCILIGFLLFALLNNKDGFNVGIPKIVWNNKTNEAHEDQPPIEWLEDWLKPDWKYSEEFYEWLDERGLADADWDIKDYTDYLVPEAGGGGGGSGGSGGGGGGGGSGSGGGSQAISEYIIPTGYRVFVIVSMGSGILQIVPYDEDDWLEGVGTHPNGSTKPIFMPDRILIPIEGMDKSRKINFFNGTIGFYRADGQKLSFIEHINEGLKLNTENSSSTDFLKNYQSFRVFICAIMTHIQDDSNALLILQPYWNPIKVPGSNGANVILNGSVNPDSALYKSMGAQRSEYLRNEERDKAANKGLDSDECISGQPRGKRKGKR